MKFNPPHKVIGTFAIFCLLMFSLFGCFRKKNAKVTLGSWLETHFPGQFEVVQSNLNLNVMDLYYGRKLALIADKADPEVQWMVNWQKDATDLGLNVAEVQAASDSARSDVAQARALFGLLKNAGLERFSVGVIGPAGPGVLGVIPGSMADPGYVVRGKGCEAAFGSCSHGIGPCPRHPARRRASSPRW